jgi:hypothetical protein
MGFGKSLDLIGLVIGGYQHRTTWQLRECVVDQLGLGTSIERRLRNFPLFLCDPIAVMCPLVLQRTL